MDILNCKICGDEFVPDRSTAKYCSKQCGVRGDTLSRKAKVDAARVIVQKKCLTCSNSFIPPISHPYQVYCSPTCLSEAMNTRAVTSGKKKESYHKYKEKYKSQKKITDTKHKDAIRFSGNKEVVLERDGHKCVTCGNDEQLIIHHIDHSGPNERPNNELNNLETLCRSCHAKHHALGIKVRGG